MVQYRVCDLVAAAQGYDLHNHHNSQDPVCVQIGTQNVPIGNWIRNDGCMVLQTVHQPGKFPLVLTNEEFDLVDAYRQRNNRTVPEPVKLSVYETLVACAKKVDTTRINLLHEPALNHEPPRKVGCHVMMAMSYLKLATECLLLAAEEQLSSTERDPNQM
jgi:hypothetical protein